MSRSDPSLPARLRFLDRSTQWLRGAIFRLPALPFFLGLVLGFGACAVAGRIVSRQPMFENFIRFFSPIQPQRYFYPTASQLVAHIRHTVPKDKTLVLVGGASYFRGTGQNPGELWTLELQRQLGPRYAVVNYATDQADLTAFAAVAFEILAGEYPRILYVANGNAASAGAVDGGEDYRYVFWDAYYKGLLPPSVAASAAVRDLRRQQLRDPVALEVHAGMWLDQFAYACDLWSYLGYTRFFTVWTDAHRFAPFEPRRRAREGEDPNIAASQHAIRRDAAYVAHSEQHARNFARTGLVQDTTGKWAPNPAFWTHFTGQCRAMFPTELRPKCLVVLLRANPFFMQTLTEDERNRTEQIYRLGQQAYEHEGYQVVSLRPADFTADDYLDGGHYVASGGFKIAHAVARHIEDSDRVEAPPLPLDSSLGGPVELTFSLPSDRRPRQEPLLVLSSSAGSESLSLVYADATTVRFGYSRGKPGDTLFSPPIAAPGPTAHTLLISFAGLYPTASDGSSGLKHWLLVRHNGQSFWEFPLPAINHPSLPALTLGQSAPATAPATRFTGTLVSATRRTASARSLHRDEIAGARLSLTLRQPMAGRSFPLATTGKPGEGDVLFLRVTSTGHAVLGYDHWGIAALLSPEIPLGFGTPHTIELHLPALAPPGTTADAIVTIDGQIVWQQRVLFYPPAPDHIYFGQNPIGATSSEVGFPEVTFEGVLAPAWRG